MYECSTTRAVLFQIFFVTLVVTSSIVAWTTGRPLQEDAHSETSHPFSRQTEEFSLKAILAIYNYYSAQFPENNSISSQSVLQTASKEALRRLILSPAQQSSLELEQRLAISMWLDWLPEQTNLYEQIKQTTSPTDFEKTIIELIDNPQLSLSSDSELRILEEEPWFGLFIAAKRSGNEENRAEYNNKITNELSVVRSRLIKSCLVLLLLALSCTLSFCGSLLFIIIGRITTRFKPSSIPPQLLLEMFCFYLFLMLAFPFLVKYYFPDLGLVTLLSINCIAITSTVIVLTWPQSFNFSFRETLSSLGLKEFSFRHIAKNMGVGFLGYLSFIPILIFGLFLYSIILQTLNIDVSQGGHPIVPILTATNSRLITTLITILAVIIAPCVEELMFRGALYSWLRSISSPRASIITSAVVFAAMHPQGPVGFLPLFLIGCFLAIMRETQNTLFAPIFAHACVNGVTMSLIFIMQAI